MCMHVHKRGCALKPVYLCMDVCVYSGLKEAHPSIYTLGPTDNSPGWSTKDRDTTGQDWLFTLHRNMAPANFFTSHNFQFPLLREV